MNTAKTILAVVVCIVALAAGIAATAHSRKILEKEQRVFPPGVLKVGETGTAAGCAITLTSADVTETVASLDTRGSDRRSAGPDWRFLRLQLSVENKSSKPVNLGKLLGGLRVIETSTGQPVDAEVVWLRDYDGVRKVKLAPGQLMEGKLAVYLSSYSLIFPFIVQIGEARFGVDVIDREAPVQDMR
ncbi:MAG: hypothetical protein FJX75_12020 [Armatimonadetes bacterium]|nr:hypothetical protein [Armatimonadota bacterium]